MGVHTPSMNKVKNTALAGFDLGEYSHRVPKRHENNTKPLPVLNWIRAPIPKTQRFLVLPRSVATAVLRGGRVKKGKAELI
jgi:hypothetical protein